MLTIPDISMHYARIYVVNPSKNRTVVSVTPLSFRRNLDLRNKNVVKAAMMIPKAMDPNIMMMKLSKTLKGVYQKKMNVLGVSISSNFKIDLKRTMVTQSLKVSYPIMIEFNFWYLS